VPARVPPIDPATYTPEQQRVAATISGARGNVRGPFTVWLRNPTLAEHANTFGIALRDSKVLERRLFELTILTVCRAWSVQYAWSAHVGAAATAGVSPDVIAAIRDNRRPEFRRDDERVVYDVATEIMQTRDLSQATYDRAVAAFGVEGTVDLISTVGYYAMVGIFLKSFDVPTPTGERPLK
jgi:4-carboxymuconolactone decarboxylase